MAENRPPDRIYRADRRLLRAIYLPYNGTIARNGTTEGQTRYALSRLQPWVYMAAMFVGIALMVRVFSPGEFVRGRNRSRRAAQQ